MYREERVKLLICFKFLSKRSSFYCLPISPILKTSEESYGVRVNYVVEPTETIAPSKADNNGTANKGWKEPEVISISKPYIGVAV